MTGVVRVLEDVDWCGTGKVPAGTWLICLDGGGRVYCRLKSDCDARLAGMGLETDLSTGDDFGGNGGKWIMYATRRPVFADGCSSIAEYRLKRAARNESEDWRVVDFFAAEERRRRSG